MNTVLNYIHITLIQVQAKQIDFDGLPNALIKSDPTSLFYLFLGVVLLLAYAKLNYSVYLNALQRAAFNINMAQQFYRSQETSLHPAAIILFLFNIGCLTLFLYLTAQHFEPLTMLSKQQTFGLAFLIVSAYHLFKLIINWLLSIIFQRKSSLSFYQFNFFFVEVVACMVLLPFLLLTAFSSQLNTQWVLILSAILLLSSLLYAIAKGIIVNINQILVNKFYFFIYFCTLEIWPFVIAYKIAHRWLIFR